MNYGQYETERRLKSLSSKTGKYTSKLVFNIFKAFFILFLFLAVAGAAVGFGMIKGIIDNAPFCGYYEHPAGPFCYYGL